MHTLRQLLRAAPTHSTPSGVFTQDRLGIELELEGVDSRPNLVWWNCIDDGSLRNNGAEFVLREGYGGGELERAIDELFEWLQDNHWEANSRCSTHFHIDMLDFNSEQVAKFILLYTTQESALFELSDPSRMYSNFCVPVSFSLPFHKKIMSNIRRFNVGGGIGQKYTALNVLPLITLGTLEYRGAGPIVDKTQMCTMIHRLQDLKAVVRASGEATAEEFLNGVVQEYTQDVANAYSLLKSYVESTSARPSMFVNTAPAGNLENMLAFHHQMASGVGSIEAHDRYFGVVAESSSVYMPAEAPSLDCSMIGGPGRIIRTHLTSGLSTSDKALVLHGLQSHQRDSMATLWRKYNGLTIRTKNRGSDSSLQPVMKIRDYYILGYREGHHWNADSAKFRAWVLARDILVANNKIVPIMIDGLWSC